MGEVPDAQPQTKRRPAMGKWAPKEEAPKKAASQVPAPPKRPPAMGKWAATPSKDAPQPGTAGEGIGGGHDSYEGVIKSFNDANGFGFIACPTTMEQYGHDVFLHHSVKLGFQVGDTVIFQVHINREGKPQASNLQAARGHKRQANDGRLNIAIPVLKQQKL